MRPCPQYARAHALSMRPCPRRALLEGLMCIFKSLFLLHVKSSLTLLGCERDRLQETAKSSRGMVGAHASQSVCGRVSDGY
jgi:hypothetical protein